MARATSPPPATASEPPSQKSFCTSTITSARTGRAYGIGPAAHRDPLAEAAPGGPLPGRGFVPQRPRGTEHEFGVVIRDVAGVRQVTVRGLAQPHHRAGRSMALGDNRGDRERRGPE